MDTSKKYVYTQRFYPLGIRGGKWVELWNWGVEADRLMWRMLTEITRKQAEWAWADKEGG